MVGGGAKRRIQPVVVGVAQRMQRHKIAGSARRQKYGSAVTRRTQRARAVCGARECCKRERTSAQNQRKIKRRYVA